MRNGRKAVIEVHSAGALLGSCTSVILFAAGLNPAYSFQLSAIPDVRLTTEHNIFESQALVLWFVERHAPTQVFIIWDSYVANFLPNDPHNSCDPNGPHQIFSRI